MKKKIALVIGASKESIFAINKAKNMKFHVIAFDENPNADGLNYADEKYITDIKNPKLIIEHLQGRKPDIILPVPIGRYLITTGKINDYYNLKGCSEFSSNICTDKYLFHKKLNKNNLRNINCNLIKANKEADENNLHFPMIVKPRYGSGNRGVIAVFSKEEYNEKIKPQIPFKEDYLFENLVGGGGMNMVLTEL